VGRRLVLVLVILAVGVAALPPVLGMVYERQIRAEFDSAPANPMVVLELADYQRGLFQSTGTFNLALTDEYLANMRASAQVPAEGESRSAEGQAAVDRMLEALGGELSVDFEVQHGPVTMNDGPEMGLAFVRSTWIPASGELSDFQARMNVPYLLRSDAQVGFDGRVEFTGHAPAMAEIDGDYGFAFSGLNFDGSYELGSRSMQMTFASESLAVEEAGQEFRLGGMAGQADLRLFSSYIWLGDMQVSMQEVAFVALGNEVPVNFVVRNAGVNAVAELNDAGDRLAFTGEYFLDSMTGIPDAELTDLRMGISFSNFDILAYEQLAQQAQSMNTASPEASQAALQELAPLVTELLRGSPSMELAPLTLKWNGQPFAADMRVNFDANELNAAEFEQLTANPALALAALSGNGKVALSEAIATQLVASALRDQLAQNLPPDSQLTDDQIAQAAAAQAAVSIETLVLQGMIERSDQLLKSDFNYADGLLTVRGTAIPLGGQ